MYNCYEHNKQICEEIIERTNTKTKNIDLIKVRWHYYYPEQLTKIGSKNGLIIKTFYGTFKKEPFTKNNNDLIFIFKRKQ